MQYSPLVKRIAGDGADAWIIHYEARAAHERGEDVILLSVGDPDLETPAPVLERAIERLRAGDTHYTPATGRQHLREAIAASPPMSSFSPGRKMRCSWPRCVLRHPATR
jgi:arginine:pyruvate transaminase